MIIKIFIIPHMPYSVIPEISSKRPENGTGTRSTRSNMGPADTSASGVDKDAKDIRIQSQYLNFGKDFIF